MNHKLPSLFNKKLGEILRNSLASFSKGSKIIEGFQGFKRIESLQSVSLPKANADLYTDFLKDTLLKSVVDVSSPKFIGHMTGPVPPILAGLSELMISLNQNLVKFETSGIGTFVERQCLGMLHNLVYKGEEDFYKKYLHNPSAPLGVITSGGTMSNVTALSYALSKHFAARNNYLGFKSEGLAEGLKEYGYSEIIVIGSPRCHYSINKALRILGLGENSFLTFEIKKEDLHKGKQQLEQLIQKKAKERALILAVIGVAGSTESGNVEPLEELGTTANKFKIHFHVDAAFGGVYLFSDRLATKMKGIELSDSVTICGHKQLYLPLGLSVCLFKNEQFASFSENNSKYQARKGSIDIGRYTIEGSRPFLSLVLHGAFHMVGKEGYAEIAESNYARGQLFKEFIKADNSFELEESSDLNIVLYRYIPKNMRNITNYNILEISALNKFNKKIQEKQFERGESFVSYTEMNSDDMGPVLWLRSVLMNPYTTEMHLREILEEQKVIAGEIQNSQGLVY